MKITELRKKIKVNLIASSLLFCLFVGIIFFINNQQQSKEEEKQKLSISISQVKTETAELQSKLNDAKKYREFWKDIDDNKKTTIPVKVDEINAEMQTIATKYNIFNPVIQITLPDVLTGGVFDRKTISVNYATGTLSFDALSDVKAYAFLAEFFAIIPGYIVISNFEMKRNKKYSTDDLVSVSLGKNPAIVNVKISFSWYFYKEKVK